MPQTLEQLPESNTSQYEQLEYQRDISTVLLLREMQQTQDLEHRRRLFDQAADQETSHISEVLKGTVRTEFNFDSLDGKLHLLQPDGVTDWQEMHRNGVKRANLRAAINPNFAPYAKIAQAELEESITQEEIVSDGRPAVLVKLSLSGNDVMSNTQLKEIGRDPDLMRAFLRVSVFDGRKLRIYSRSIDGVNLSDGKRIADGWGVFDQPQAKLGPDCSSIDILNTDIILDESQLSVEQMHMLADKLVASYDELQFQKTGKLHKAGLNPEGIDTYKFVTNNLDLMNAHMEGLTNLSVRELQVGILADCANDLRYDIMSSFKQRLEGTWVQEGSLAESVSSAGSGERAQGTQFSGCDTVIGASLNAANSGYANGGEVDKSLMDLSGKRIQCGNTKCKKKVVVPDSDLREGILSCSECGLELDVCTGESRFRSAAQAEKKESEESPLAKWNREYDFKKEQEKLALQAELANAA